jgi:uncharacterized protein with FMN-binding domain
MFPKRGALGAFITIIALVALLGYKTPELTPPSDPGAYIDSPAAPSSGVAFGAIDGETSSYPPDGSAADVTAAGSASLGPTNGSGSAAGTGAPSGTSQPSAAGQSPTFPGQSPTSPGQTPSGPGSTPVPTSPPPTRPPTPTPPPVQGRTGSSTGSVVSTRYGSVQVRVVYSNGRITDVVTLQSPNAASESRTINARACPILRSEALSAQSAGINTVSGATYTSNAYKTSLQYAIGHP